MDTPFSVEVEPNWEGLLQSVERRGMPERVHHIELFLDAEIQEAICDEYHLLDGLDPDDPYVDLRRQIVIQSFLGYDFVRAGVEGIEMPLNYDTAEDTAGLKRSSGRNYVNENEGPITNWDQFEAYPWPDPANISTRSLEWYSENLPDNMCIVGSGGFAHFAELLTWVMGYTTFCMALYEQRDLVAAIARRLDELYEASLDCILSFDRVKIAWGSDDMGYRGGPLASPADMREFVLAGHKLMASKTHAAGRPYLLHSCGNLELLMDDLINDVEIDAKHSFEDTIEFVTDAKRNYGGRIALLGGIDLDFLCRSTEAEVRQRVRDTLDVCMEGGGYCLGTGNSVANYVPVANYLAMVDEGRRWRA